jgi:hypothetical protein
MSPYLTPSGGTIYLPTGSVVNSMSQGGQTYGGGAGASSAAYIPGGAATGYDPATGGIPQLPNYSQDTSSMVGTNVQGQMIQNLPGYQNAVSTDMGNIQNNLSGTISPDVIAKMQQQAAERGIATGSPGSPNANAAYLQALGLTSLQLQQLGHTQLDQQMAATPIQQTQNTTTNTDLRPQQAVYNAAPNPQAASLAAQQAAQRGMTAGSSMAGSVPGVSQGAINAATSGWNSQVSPGGGYVSNIQPAVASYGYGLSAPAKSQSTPVNLVGNTYGGNWNYNQPFDYSTSGGSSLAWTGQDWSSLFDDSFGDVTQPDNTYSDQYGSTYDPYGQLSTFGDLLGESSQEDWSWNDPYYYE